VPSLRAALPPQLLARPLSHVRVHHSQVFYTASFDGILFVYDLANSVSRRNLEKWKQEWQQVYFGGTGGSAPAGGRHSPRGFHGGALWGDEAPEAVNYLSPQKRSRDLQSTWSGGGASRGSIRSLDGVMPPTLTVGNKQDLVSCAGAAAGRSSNFDEIEGGQGCHEIAVAACRKYVEGAPPTSCSLA
jgi:hypothetical protein